MNITRRSLFGGAIGALFAPVLAKAAALAPSMPFQWPRRNPDFGEIVAATLRNRSGNLADNVLEHNALLRHLSKAGRIE